MHSANNYYEHATDTLIFTFQEFIWVPEQTLESWLEQDGRELVMSHLLEDPRTADNRRLQRLSSTRQNNLSEIVQNGVLLRFLKLTFAVFCREKVGQAAKEREGGETNLRRC